MDCNNPTCTSTRRGLFSIQKEFTCAICHELFVKAHTLSCSHSYCERCISSWLKKCQECPTCRKPIESKPVHCISLDNAVGKLVELRVENFAERLKNSNAIQSSTGAIQKNTRATPMTKQAECSTQTSPQQSRDSSRNKNYNNSTFVRHIFHSYNGGPLHEFHYCNGSCHEYDDYSDDEYSDDYSNDDDDDDYYDDYNGLPGYYWGGYGACFNCGDPYHWANGCPEAHW